MVNKIKRTLMRSLYPFRKFSAKFVRVNQNHKDSIIYKAACLTIAEVIEGDYFEFGVYQGTNFKRAYKIINDRYEKECQPHINNVESNLVELKSHWKNMRFFAFDSFSGLPEPEGIDKQSYSYFTEGNFSCTVNDFHNKLLEARLPLDKVVTVPGFFNNTCNDKTIKEYQIKKASIIYIDCDLYDSTKTVLNFIESLLTDGTIIIFDDWYTFRGNPNRGEQRAFNEWKQNMNGWRFTEYQKEGVYKNSFIANKLDLDNF